MAKSANPTDYVLVFGDFNLPSVSWNSSPDSSFLVPLNCNDFINQISDLCLYQINGAYNINNKLLDLIFVNEPSDCTINRSYPITKPEDSFHPTLELNCSMLFPVLPKSSKKQKIYNFKRANYELMNYYFYNVDWNGMFARNNGSPVCIENLLTTFYKTISSVMEKCVPKRYVYNSSGPPWNTKQLSMLKNKKNKFFKKYKKSNSIIDYANYSICRVYYNRLNSVLYNNYMNKIKSNFKNNPKSFFSFVNSKRKSCSFPPIMKYLNVESDDCSLIADMFADFFSTTYSNSKYSNTGYPYQICSNSTINFPSVSHADIELELLKLKPTTNHGPDGIPNCILRYCAQSLSKPLSLLFNSSITYGYVPSQWKTSFIIPLFKSGCKSDVKNYRGIAKLNSIPMVLEKIISNFLSYNLSHLITQHQHGFRKGRSTITNLLHLTTLINNGFVNNQQTDVIYTDFSKAFDKVNHQLLIYKLYMMGFSSNSLSWITSYLKDRKQNVLFNNYLSKPINVLSGVPQGSHLGPILFSLFINDLPIALKHSNILMFADDVKIFYTYNNISHHIYLQQDLNNFYAWCSLNLMELNFNKCKHMSFYRNNYITNTYLLNERPLEFVSSFLDLGIMLDAKLSFNLHINMIVNKARGVLAFIKRWGKEFTDPYVTKLLYTSLVRPILEYGSVVWDPVYNIYIDRIESIQKQFLLFCLRSLCWNRTMNLPSYHQRLALIKLPTLKSRRIMLNVTFVINIINGDVCSDFLLRNITFNVPQRPTRYFYPLMIKYFRTNYANADPLRRICLNYNELYQFIDFSLTTNKIKSNIITFLNC